MAVWKLKADDGTSVRSENSSEGSSRVMDNILKKQRGNAVTRKTNATVGCVNWSIICNTRKAVFPLCLTWLSFIQTATFSLGYHIFQKIQTN